MGFDKRMTEDDVVGQLRPGMTIGIGGWGSRRKPMSLVRAIARSDLDGLTIVTYGGPDVGLTAAKPGHRGATPAMAESSLIGPRFSTTICLCVPGTSGTAWLVLSDRTSIAGSCHVAWTRFFSCNMAVPPPGNEDSS